MPPIPVHIEDPITPKKADGVTPQTQPNPSVTTAAAPVITTPISSPSTRRYAPAQPGQPAVPAPTGAAYRPNPPPTATYQPAGQSGPPAPQPGAVPIAPQQANPTGIPPPPTASNAAVPVTAPPPQAQWSSPQQNYAPSHSTDPTTPQQRAGPTTLNLGPVTGSPASHPQGYQQNVYAQELNPAQRASLDQQRQREQQDVGILGNFSSPQTTEKAESMWNAVKGFGNTAGQKLAQAHGEAWKWIDGKT